MSVAPKFALDELEHQVVAAALAETEILEYVAVRYKGRLSGRLSSLFNAAHSYYNITRGLLTRDALQSILINNEPDFQKHAEYLALFDTLKSAPYATYSDSDRRWFLHQFDEEWKVKQTGTILARAAEVMREGYNVQGRPLTGADAAWQVLSEERLRFNNLTSGSSLHEAEITATTDAAKQDYHWATENKYLGCPLALPEVNERMAGLRAGDLYVVAGFASEGKSFMMLNDAHAAWRSGKNVAIATGEMSVKKYRNRLIALHSNEPHFSMPLQTREIDRGALNVQQHEVFLQVLEDIKENPKYGKFFIFQFPYRATPSLIFNKFASFDQIVPLDLAVIDYMGLMSSERARVSRREELDDLIRETKALALDFGNGRGLALEAGYQTNRVSYETARREGYYTLACFADSAEVEKSADAALWLLSLPQNQDELKAGLVKNRDDELGEHFHLRRNLRYAQLTSLRSSRGRSAAPAASDSILDV